jgi:hypothetical protein
LCRASICAAYQGEYLLFLRIRDLRKTSFVGEREAGMQAARNASWVANRAKSTPARVRGGSVRRGRGGRGAGHFDALLHLLRSKLANLAQVTLRIPPRVRLRAGTAGRWPLIPRSQMPRGIRRLSWGEASGQGPRAGHHGLPSLRSPDVGDRRHSRSCADPQDHLLPDHPSGRGPPPLG